MNEHQQAVWASMLRTVSSYENGEMELSAMVRALEGLLDAGEFRDPKLRAEWYERWGPLEVRVAVGQHDGQRDQARAEVQALKEFLAAHSELD